jgi:hypothetical protein
MYVFWAVFHPMAKVTVHNCAVRLAESQPRLTVEYDHIGIRVGLWNGGWGRTRLGTVVGCECLVFNSI